MLSKRGLDSTLDSTISFNRMIQTAMQESKNVYITFRQNIGLKPKVTRDEVS